MFIRLATGVSEHFLHLFVFSFQKSKFDTIEEMIENPEFKFMLFQGGSTHNLLKVITYLFGPYLTKQQMDPITRGVYTYHGPEMKHFDWVLKVNYYVFCKTTKTKRPF